jgi:sugar lactone lactonase YvrE
MQRAVSAAAVPLAVGGVMAASLIASAPASNASGTSTTYTTGFVSPVGIALDSAGHLYVSDYDSSTVTKVITSSDPTQPKAFVIVGSGFRSPIGVAVDKSNNVYVADYLNNRVEKVTADGVQSDVGSGISFPTAVAVNQAGDVFATSVSDIVEISAAGVQTTVATGFTFAQGMALDAAGNVFVSDTQNHVGYIARIDHATHAVTRVATGLAGPEGVAIDASGNLIVAERDAGVVAQISGGRPKAILASDAQVPTGVAVTSAGEILAGSFGSRQGMTGKILQVGSSLTAPAITMSALPSVSQSTKLVPTWTSTAVADIAGVDVRYRAAAAGAALPAAYKTLASGTHEFSANFVAATDTRYCFSAMSKTAMGTMSAWSAETCTNIPMDDRALVRHKATAWSSVKDAAALASTASSATVKGSSLTTVKARKVSSIAILGWTGPAAGSVDVYVGVKKVGTVSFKAGATQRTLLAPIKLAKPQTGKVSLVVTSTGKQVKIDGIALS